MKRPEQEIHRAVVLHLRQRAAPGVEWWHTNNNVGLGGLAGIKQGARNKRLGVKAGVSDILAIHNRKFFALEIKAPGEHPTKEQWAYIDKVRANGFFAHYADNLDSALGILETWGLIRGRA